MFDRIAPRYDFANHLLSAGIDHLWRRLAVDALALETPGLVLDVCTGTGDLLLEALRRGHRGVGVDFSLEMLRRGMPKLRASSGKGVLASGDAERLPVLASSFDGALVAFGIRNVSSPALALKEIQKSLRPGGRLALLEFSMPQGALSSLYRFYFSHVLPRLGGWVSGCAEAYAYLPASVERFASPAELALLLAEAGFERVGRRSLTGGIAHLYTGEKPR